MQDSGTSTGFKILYFLNGGGQETDGKIIATLLPSMLCVCVHTISNFGSIESHLSH